ncbi:SCO4848 family membrane protein [Nonomuraea maheshkhaliensis]|uniref:SCO4848 family membrane protein n=1 Tax=Nonomuraea maheshkhaliensis TaxID=419590 RepID=UPI003D15B365
MPMWRHIPRRSTFDTREAHVSRKLAAFLIILGVFMIFEWVNLGFNLADGHPTAFYVVHGVLIAVNVVLGVVLGIIGWRAVRGSGSGSDGDAALKGRRGDGG